MLLLITYDVSTVDRSGQRRLRKIAKECAKYGQRVQNSVFECNIDAAQSRALQHTLLTIMDPAQDSLRFYNLGNNYSTRIEHFGIKETYDSEGFLEV